MSKDENLFISQKGLLKKSTSKPQDFPKDKDDKPDASDNTSPIPDSPATYEPPPPEPSKPATVSLDDEPVISKELEREMSLAINRELHVSYCYLVLGSTYTR